MSSCNTSITTKWIFMNIIIGFTAICWYASTTDRLILRINGLFHEDVHAFLCTSRSKFAKYIRKWKNVSKKKLCFMLNTFSLTLGDKDGQRLQVMCVSLSTAVFWRSISVLLLIMAFYLGKSTCWPRAQHCTGTSVRELARFAVIAVRTRGVTRESWIAWFRGVSQQLP